MLVKENIDFKRNRSSREALDIGPTIVPSDILIELKKRWIEEYKDSLKLLIGKKVEVKTTPHPFTSWNAKNKKRRIIVKDIHHGADPENNIIHDFVIEDIDGNKYRVPGHEPIKIFD